MNLHWSLLVMLWACSCNIVQSGPVVNCGETGHGIVFDAGSSHTSMFIYNWPDNKTDGTGKVMEIGSCDVEGGGISDYVDEPKRAGESLKPCLQEAADKIPEIDQAFTPVYLGSTAGMRLVQETDPVASAAIFDSVRHTLAGSPFHFNDSDRQARIISGENEGVFGWVTTNFLANRFKVGPTLWDTMMSAMIGTEPSPKPTYGALDLGGASTQMTFVPEDPDTLPEKYKIHKRLYGINYNLYSNSFLCYGANEARRRLQALILKNANYSTDGVDNPCMHTGQNEIIDGVYLWKAPCSKGPEALAGWGSEVTPPDDMADISYSTRFIFNGTSNSQQCAAFVSELFNVSAPCEYQPCSFNGVHQPSPYGKFLAFSAFYFVIDALLGTTTPTIAAIDQAKVDFCAKGISEVMNMPNYNKYYLTYCFNIHYVRTLLVDRYGFEESNWDIEFVKKVNDVSVGWTMGYMIDATSRIPSEVDCVGGGASGNALQRHLGIWSLSFIAVIRYII